MRISRRSRLADWLKSRQLERVTQREFEELLREFAPVSESALRHLLRDSGVPLEAAVRGVDQSTLPLLRETLLDLTEEYTRGNSGVRRVVITAKDHAKFAAARNPDKQEMVLWMLTWLENPSVFPAWVAMRSRLLKLD